MSTPTGTSRTKRIAWTVASLIALIVLAFNVEAIARLRHQVFPKRFGIVEPGKIYRSGQLSARLVRHVLEENHIAVVVDLTADAPPDPSECRDEAAEKSALADLGIERRQHILLSDGTGDVTVYAAAVKSVVEAERAGSPVLIHCAAGTQRTGGVVALYRLLVQGRPSAEVYREMQAYKYSARYSPRLLEYLNDNMAALANELVRNGAIERVPDQLPVLRGEG
ncbi:MAG: hypothetical protein EHM42_03095 [Planctomycetaceae bacterium]|nr:MAG: hypothetical protein EHM42_03095 [Planctomycetaceae bacterium]